MGIFGYIKTCKNEKQIQELLDKIGHILYNVESVRSKNLHLFSAHEISSFELDLCAIVDTVREIEYICDNGNRKILRCTKYRYDGVSCGPLGWIIKDILERVMQCRSCMNLPTVFQEEFDVFSRYKFD